MAKKPTLRQQAGWARLASRIEKLEEGTVEAGLFRRRSVEVKKGRDGVHVTATHVEWLSRTVTLTTLTATYDDIYGGVAHVHAHTDTYLGGNDDYYYRSEFDARPGEVVVESLPVSALLRVLGTARRAQPQQPVVDEIPIAPQAAISAQYLQSE